jgi:hypothetical protein
MFETPARYSQQCASLPLAIGCGTEHHDKRLLERVN